jgi:hypothetical protein
MDVRLTLITLLTVPCCLSQPRGFAKARARALTWCAHEWRASLLFFRSTVSGAQTVQIFNAETKSRERFAN